MGLWQIIFNIAAVVAILLCLGIIIKIIPDTKQSIEQSIQTLKNVNLADLTKQLNTQKDTVTQITEGIKNNIKVIETNLDNLSKTDLPKLINDSITEAKNILEKARKDSITIIDNTIKRIDNDIITNKKESKDSFNLIEQKITKLNTDLTTAQKLLTDKIDVNDKNAGEKITKLNTDLMTIEKSLNNKITDINKSIDEIISKLIPNLQNNIDNLSNIIKTKNIVIRNDIRDVWNIELIDDDLCIRNNISGTSPLCLDKNNNLFIKNSETIRKIQIQESAVSGKSITEQVLLSKPEKLLTE